VQARDEDRAEDVKQARLVAEREAQKDDQGQGEGDVHLLDRRKQVIDREQVLSHRRE
jgi:hypothetical protein